MTFQRHAANTAFPRETKVEIVTLTELRTPVVRSGIDYWQRLRGERPYPMRDEICVRDISGLLKHMVFSKVQEGADDFLLKIVGDEVCRAYRAPLINRYMREIASDLPNMVQRWLPLYQHVARSGEPLAVIVTVGLDVPEINFTHAETVCLPFGPAGGPVDHVVTFGQHVAEPDLSRI